MLLSVILWAGNWLTPKNLTIYPFEEHSLILIQGNSAIGLISPETPNYAIYGALIGKDDINYLPRIIACESGNNPLAKNPKSSAFGLCQFISGTWDYVQKKWDMKLERENPKDQLYACERLWEEEGEKHWLESKSCWSQ